ncbi:hypothetical protein QEN19_003076 [Hanseniaspora menglaensis]
MFKNISQQLGTNLSSLKDEISKQIQEKREDFNELYENSTQQTVSNMTLPEEYKALPKEVQIKMMKFMKYEEKYPQLLSAYKKFRQDTIDLTSVNESLEMKIEDQVGCLNVMKQHYDFENSEDLGDFLAKWTEREQLVKTELALKNKEISKLQERIEFLEKEAIDKIFKQPKESSENEESKENEENKEKDESQLETPKFVSSQISETKLEETLNSASEPADDTTSIDQTLSADSSVTKEKESTLSGPITSSAELSANSTDGKESSVSLEHIKSATSKPKSAMQWQIKYSSLERDHKQLQKDYFEAKDNLKLKDEEINNVKEMLKEVGNQLVDMKDKQKQSFSTKTVEEAKFKTLENTNKQLQSRNVSLSLENQKLQTAIGAKETEIKNLELEIKQCNMKNTRLNNRLEESLSEKQTLTISLEKINSKLEQKLKENGQLEERVLILKEKSLQTENIKSTSTDIVDSLTRQCGELNSKLRETVNLKNNVEEELSQTNDKLYKQKRDLQMLNEQVMKCEVEVKILKQEKAELIIQVEMLSKEKITVNNESADHLKQIIDEKTQETVKLQEKLNSTEKQIIELKQNLEALGTLNKEENLLAVSKSNTTILDQTIINLKEELQSKNKTLNNMELTLKSLRKLNKDLNFKIDKLNKIYQQQRIASNSDSRKSSYSSETSKEEEEADAKIFYIKNVLIGFIEHKEQRQQLLPVIATLLQFTQQDQQKFLMSLK